MSETEIVDKAKAEAAARMTTLIRVADDGARSIPIDSSKSILMYFNAARHTLHEGRNATANGNQERAFVLLMRFGTFMLESLPQHAGYRTTVNPEKRELMLEADMVLEELTSRKANLLARLTADAQQRIREQQSRLRSTTSTRDQADPAALASLSSYDQVSPAAGQDKHDHYEREAERPADTASPGSSPAQWNSSVLFGPSEVAMSSQATTGPSMGGVQEHCPPG